MKRIIALLTAVLLCLSLAACGESEPASADSATKDSIASAEAAIKDTADSSSETAANKSDSDSAGSNNSSDVKFSSVEEYIQHPDVKKNLETVTESLKQFSDTMTFSYHAEGNQLHYDYKYVKQYDEENVQRIKETIEADLENNSAYTSIVDEMKQYIDIDNPQFVITYFNADGSVILTKTFE